MARPRIDIDESQFKKLCAIQCTEDEIASRRTQFRMAETNCSMAIWLGKQYLGQKEQQEIAVSRNDDETIKEMERYFDNKKSGS